MSDLLSLEHIKSVTFHGKDDSFYTGPNSLDRLSIEFHDGMQWTLHKGPDEDRWRITSSWDNDLPLWSHGTDSMGVVPQTIADPVLDHALTMLVGKVPLEENVKGRLQRAFDIIAGQLDLFE